MLSPFGPSLGGCSGQANSLSRGTARKTSLLYSLKTKEMIMPGIMSEGSTAWRGSRCEERPECQDGRPGMQGRWRELEEHRQRLSSSVRRSVWDGSVRADAIER